MNLFRRLSATVNATMDQAVAQIENHDAVVSAALQDARQSAAQARVRLRRVERDGQQLHARCQSLHTDIQRWQQRARHSAREDETLALKCVARMQDAQRELAVAETAAAEHEQQQQMLQQGMQKIQQRISRIEQQRSLLRTRQSSAQAQQLVATLEPVAGEGIDEILERWEGSIMMREHLPWEIAGGASADAFTADPLAEQFRQTENSEELREALQQLLAASDAAESDPQPAMPPTQHHTDEEN